MARYIENGFAKVAPCECSTSAIFEKAFDGDSPTWCCRNCGEHKPRRIRSRKDDEVRVNRDGDIEVCVNGVWAALTPAGWQVVEITGDRKGQA